ncbi:hypothetical protein [Nocardioides sp. R-C-SC26]|uniref:hypothetical protein n=1 Tax=Nocardioides sp. R-C-SC26 TaxID=2870414 RepID=UPI001E5B7818|nr:hypothetical protein [Nocardioides sp. R-C-SC26]
MASPSPPARRDRVADSSIAWRILLTARLPSPVDADHVRLRLTELYRDQAWGAPPSLLARASVGSAREQEESELLRDLGEVRGAPVVVGCIGDLLMLSADHADLDGLAILAALGTLVDGGAASSARGVGERADTGTFGGAAVRRLREAVLRPPAGVARGTTAPAVVSTGDIVVSVPVPHGPGTAPGTADLIVAAAAGVREHNERNGRAGRRVAIAVGVARERPGAVLRDRSALIRITDAETMERDEVTHRLREGATEPAPSASGALGGLAVGLALRALRRRLGSTLLVSHLGRVEAPGLTTSGALAFYPVSAGGTGLSLGAVTHGGVTVVTLRGRGRDWSRKTLASLLGTIVDHLDDVGPR